MSPDPATTLISPRAALLALVIGAPLLAAPSDPPASAPAAEPRALLIDDQLAARPITLVSLDEQILTFVDEQQRRRTLARQTLLAFIPEQAPDPTPFRARPILRTIPGVLELIDGQRFPGDLFPAAGGDESIAWTQPILGQLTYRLDLVASFTRTAPADRPIAPIAGRAAASDLIYLTNGDTITGFLASLGDPVRIEADGAAIELPPDRIAAARLSNSRTEPSGSFIWLADGTVARVSRLTIEPPGRIAFALDSGPAASIRWDQLRAAVLDTTRLSPLARLEPDSYSPAEGRRYAPPIRALVPAASTTPSPMDADDLLLPGPMRITWTLPPGTRRIAFNASLADDAAPWGDCELIVRVDSTEVLRRRLNADTPSTPVSVPAEGKSLTIAVEPGRFGPIRDWVVLSRPLLLIAPPRDPGRD